MDPFDASRMAPAPADVPTGREHLPPRHRPGEKFLKGPIPWDWLVAATALPGKALAVGLVIWFEAGCRNAGTVPVNLSNLSNLGIPRRTAIRALQALSEVALVKLEHRAGRPTLVTLLPAPPTESGATTKPECPPPSH